MASPLASTVAGVKICYDLLALPTAQHKAGLAGLLLQIQSMLDRKLLPDEIPVVHKASRTATTVEILFTEKNVQSLFDDLYAAKHVEAVVANKWTKKPLAEREVTLTDDKGKQKTEKRYVYSVVQPRGYFLRQYLPGGEEGAWHKLWRDMLWAIPRGNPQSRKPFQQRADGQPCKEGQEAWRNLVRVEKARRKNGFHTTAVSSSLWLGAQDCNAESLPFSDRAEHLLLLHFWPLTCLLFTPEVLKLDGNNEFAGYVVAIPEVSDLKVFCERYPRMLAQLEPKVRGFRPAEAVISLPFQGALSFLDQLTQLSPAIATEKFTTGLSAVEYLHLVKIGNNVKMQANGRVQPNRDILERYRMLTGADRPAPYQHPLFVNGLLDALTTDQAWYQCFDKMLVVYPASFFVAGENPSQRTPFWRDAFNKFDAERKNQQALEEVYKLMDQDESLTPSDLSDPETKSRLALVLERMVRRYTLCKAKSRCNLDPNAPMKQRTPGELQKIYEYKQRIAQDTFLAVRSRKGKDVARYFSETIGFSGHYFGKEKATGDYALLASALTDPNHQEDLKTLILLALSANSYIRTKEGKE